MSDIPIQGALRAETYQVLSECFKEPCLEFAEDVAGGFLHRELSRRLGGFGIALPLEGLKVPGEPPEVLRILREEYYPLFIGPFPPFALPVESVYKSWAREGESPLIASDVVGMLMGDPAVDMLNRYQSAGIEIPKALKEMPDHLTLLLEYMALLCEAGEAEEQGRFLRRHLDWLPELRRVVQQCSEQREGELRFYRAVLDATAAFLSHERRVLFNEGGSLHDSTGQVIHLP